MKKWEHNELAEDLADCKGTGFLDVPLGSVLLNNGTQRADVIEIKPSYTRFCITIYEVKVSRGDFLSDIRTEKYKGYLEHCHNESLIEMVRQDICEGLGLKYNPNAWGSPEWELAKLVREIKEKVEKEGVCS